MWGFRPAASSGLLVFAVVAMVGCGGVEPTTCEADTHALEGACVACPAGAVNGAGDDPAKSDTACEPIRCDVDQHVQANTCVSCAAGTTRPEGDDASGTDTSCEPIRCGTDQHVQANTCVSCAAGTTRPEGDDVSGADTSCEPLLCGTDQYVQANTCVSCAAGTTRPEGDDASGADTHCEPILCGLNEHVEDHACVSCPTGMTNPADDDASGADTSCAPADACSAVFGVSCSRFEQGYLKASNTEAAANFGTSLAMDGDLLAVGAPYEEGDGTFRSGAVYVFERSGTTWAQIGYLKASNTGLGDLFGASLAVHGDTLAVGAPYEDSQATGVNGDQTDDGAASSGAVYIFTRSGAEWSQTAYLKASNTDPVDYFGHSLALDADTLVVGAPGEGSGATGVNGDQTDNGVDSSGAVYVFTRSGTEWSQSTYLKASNTDAIDYFGWSVALDGETLAVGALYEQSGATGVDGDQADNGANGSGAVYVFTRSGTTWSQTAYLKASNTGANNRFGDALALDGDLLAVGAPTEESSATGVDGDQADNGADGSGAVYVFTRNGATWSQTAYLKASNTEAGDRFGLSVALRDATLVVGAPYEASGATGVNGDQSDNSSIWSGAVYVFRLSGTTWSQAAYLKASNNDANINLFGEAVATQAGTLAVGAPYEDSGATGVNGDQSDKSAESSGAVYVRLLGP